MEIVTLDPEHPDPHGVARVAAVLRVGGLVAFPTETVYGLGANARDEDAVKRLFAAKGRPVDNPLIVHVGDRDSLAAVAARMTPLAGELTGRWWPGPLTVVLDAAADIPSITTGGLPTVAVRMPDHPVALALLRVAGVPVAAPSANRSGRPSPTTAAHVLADLAGEIDVLVDAGPCRVGVESTVVDARGETPIVLREGAITREMLAVVAARAATDAERGASPGTRYRHYAPHCEVEISPPGAAVQRAAALAAAGESVALVATGSADPPVRTLATFKDAAELARVLYDALRAAEAAGVDVLVVEAVPEVGIGRAVMDRLRRAASG